MIKSFADSDTEDLAEGTYVKGFPDDVRRRAQRKLEMVDGATSLRDLRHPPGNRLEKLRGDREGQFSIRINDQWRVCFVWEDGDAFAVEVTDYHG